MSIAMAMLACAAANTSLDLFGTGAWKADVARTARAWRGASPPPAPPRNLCGLSAIGHRVLPRLDRKGAMRRRQIRFAGVVAALTVQVGPALAAPAVGGAPLQVAVGAGALYRPEYSGSDDYEVKPLPLVMLRYERAGYAIVVGGAGAVVDVARDPRLVFGPLLRYRPGRHDVSDPVVRKLPELDDAVEAGVRLAYGRDLGGGRLVAGVDYLHDVSGVHHGQTLQASLSFERPLSPKVVLGARGAVTYADRDFMRSYYGVDGGAGPSGLPGYAPDPGLQAGEAGLSLRWSLDPRWSVIGSAAYERLMDEAARSPIVRLRGSRNQTSLALGVVRRF